MDLEEEEMLGGLGMEEVVVERVSPEEVIGEKVDKILGFEEFDSSGRGIPELDLHSAMSIEEELGELGKD